MSSTGIERRSPTPLANTLTIKPMARLCTGLLHYSAEDLNLSQISKTNPFTFEKIPYLSILSSIKSELINLFCYILHATIHTAIYIHSDIHSHMLPLHSHNLFCYILHATIHIAIYIHSDIHSHMLPLHSHNLFCYILHATIHIAIYIHSDIHSHMLPLHSHNLFCYILHATIHIAIYIHSDIHSHMLPLHSHIYIDTLIFICLYMYILFAYMHAYPYRSART